MIQSVGAQSVSGTPTCPLCGRPAPVDQFGFVECPCGWGGPGDPVEAASGLSRRITLLDRRYATSVARGELTRIARNKTAAGGLDPLYTTILMMASTVIYLIIGALLVGSAILFVQSLLGAVWLGAVVMGVITLYLLWTLFGFPERIHDIVAPLSEFPQLEALMGEVAARVGVKSPRWVIVFPGANFSISRRMLWGRALTPQVVVRVGAACLGQMNDLELCAVLAHELAHYLHEHTFFGRYFGGAEAALHNIIDGMRAGVSTNYRGRRTVMRGSSVSLGTLVGVFVIWIITLPLRLLWFDFHLLRLRQSRIDEYDADASACMFYGPQAFINGLTSVLTTAATMRGASQSLRQEMAKHNNSNYFVELRRHYAELPREYLGEMRTKAARGYRSLENSHPITPDRIRAALLLGAREPGVLPSRQSVADIITPAGAADASGIERQLTGILFAGPRRRR